jgi:acylphosphatase
VDNASAHIIIRGRVQGVNFRAWVWTHNRGALRGWVRNVPDGSVEIVCTGSRRAIEELIILCRRGPRAALVEDIAVEWNVPIHPMTDGFTIRNS